MGYQIEAMRAANMLPVFLSCAIARILVIRHGFIVSNDIYSLKRL
jgi:hypothetical protein